MLAQTRSRGSGSPGLWPRGWGPRFQGLAGEGVKEKRDLSVIIGDGGPGEQRGSECMKGAGDSKDPLQGERGLLASLWCKLLYQSLYRWTSTCA